MVLDGKHCIGNPLILPIDHPSNYVMVLIFYARWWVTQEQQMVLSGLLTISRAIYGLRWMRCARE